MTFPGVENVIVEFHDFSRFGNLHTSKSSLDILSQNWIWTWLSFGDKEQHRVGLFPVGQVGAGS